MQLADEKKSAAPGVNSEETLLFVLRELERVQLLVARLRDRGVVTDVDITISTLQSELRYSERMLAVAQERGRDAEALTHRAEIAKLKRQIALVEDK